MLFSIIPCASLQQHFYLFTNAYFYAAAKPFFVIFILIDMKAITFIFCLFFMVCLSLFSDAQTDTSHLFTSFDKTNIYYEVKGSGYPVILVHGFINTSQNWKRTQVYKALLDAGFKVIILDMRGNGKSDKPHTADAYANDAEAKDIMGLATMLNLPFYNVVGYSRGSIITARLLVLDKRVHKAVLGGMGTDFTNPEWPRRKMFYRALSGDTVKELEPLLKRVHQDTSLDQQALAYMQKEQPSTPIEVLKKIKQPVLVICGDKDSDNGNAQNLAAVFAHSKFAQVPGDHGAAVTTKEFADNVVAFFVADKGEK